MSKKNRIRIFINRPLQPDESIVCPEDQTHYLLNVMRLKQGETVYVFNGRDGEYAAALEECQKKSCVLKIEKKYADFFASPDIWLLFSLLKKDNTDWVIEKAVELGVSKIIPVITDYTIVTKIKQERLISQIIEASEQCRRQDIPMTEHVQKLELLLKNWPTERKLFYLDETGNGCAILTAFNLFSGPAALLIGPEGGFSEKELELLRKLPYTQGVSLGKRILRAETAAVSALACWQALCGDWR